MEIEFIKPDSNESWMQQFKSIYEEFNIYRTIIVVDDHSTLELITKFLEEDTHSYYIVPTKSLDYNKEFINFIESCKRILILTYEDYMLGFCNFINVLIHQHNLLISENLEPFEEKKRILRAVWRRDS
jgi:hypothetical protein